MIHRRYVYLDLKAKNYGGFVDQSHKSCGASWICQRIVSHKPLMVDVFEIEKVSNVFEGQRRIGARCRSVLSNFRGNHSVLQKQTEQLTDSQRRKKKP